MSELEALSYWFEIQVFSFGRDDFGGHNFKLTIKEQNLDLSILVDAE